MSARSVTVELPSRLRLACIDAGPSSTFAVVLLPGPTDSAVSYTRVLAHLPQDLRSLAVSPRGHGDSDKPEANFGVEDFAADTVALLDAAGLERAVLVGHSGSCLVARRVCLDHPERVAGLVMEASPTTLRGNPELQEFVDSMSQLSDPIDPTFARDFVTGLSSETLDSVLVDALVDEVRKVPARVWAPMFGALLDYDDVAELERIDVPVTLAWGDADPLVSRAMQEELLTRLADSRLEVYAGVGHTPRWEDPARFAHDVAALAGRVT